MKSVTKRPRTHFIIRWCGDTHRHDYKQTNSSSSSSSFSFRLPVCCPCFTFFRIVSTTVQAFGKWLRDGLAPSPKVNNVLELWAVHKHITMSSFLRRFSFSSSSSSSTTLNYIALQNQQTNHRSDSFMKPTYGQPQHLLHSRVASMKPRTESIKTCLAYYYFLFCFAGTVHYVVV